MKDNILILGIESSCDETSCAVVCNGTEVISNVISSQIELHQKFGGVVPEVASRKHIENISAVVSEALETAHLSFEDMDGIAVTYGPGLVGALLVGLSYAKGLCFATNKPLIGVHHIEGHICANYLENPSFQPPFICLVVSGGHTHLVHVKDHLTFEILGKTRDDAAGEAFDKISRALGLGYPGGPNIDALAKTGNKEALFFPRAFRDEDHYDFSFSGLKSSVLNYINKCNMQGVVYNKADVAAAFQDAVVDVLVTKAIRLCKETNIHQLAIAGGVACNSALRAEMTKQAQANNITLNIPKPLFCTDHAAMIASAGYFEYINGHVADHNLNAYPNLVLGRKVMQ